MTKRGTECMTPQRPSDRAIAQAFWEIWDSPEYDNVTDGIYLRAEQIDATAAPVVVGEDAYDWEAACKRAEHALEAMTDAFNAACDELDAIRAASNQA